MVAVVVFIGLVDERPCSRYPAPPELMMDARDNASFTQRTSLRSTAWNRKVKTLRRLQTIYRWCLMPTPEPRRHKGIRFKSASLRAHGTDATYTTPGRSGTIAPLYCYSHSGRPYHQRTNTRSPLQPFVALKGCGTIIASPDNAWFVSAYQRQPWIEHP